MKDTNSFGRPGLRGRQKRPINSGGIPYKGLVETQTLRGQPNAMSQLRAYGDRVSNTRAEKIRG